MDLWREKLAAAVASATLFYFGTGLSPVPVLAWLAPVPVLLIAPRVSGRAAAGVAFAALFLGMTNSWSWYSWSHDMPLWPWGLVVTLGLALTFVLVVWIYRGLVSRGRPVLAVVSAPAAWVGTLYLVSVANPMGLQGTLATTQADWPLLMQTAAVTGAWGVEYLVLMVAAALATRSVRVAAAAIVVLALALGGGALRMDTGEPAQKVALVASNQKGWAADLRTQEGLDLVDAYVSQLDELPAGVRTVVLPEAAFGSDEARPAALEQLADVAQARGFDLVVGYAHWDGTKKYNYALTFLASGGEPVSYLKHHDTVSPPGSSLALPGGGTVGIEICMDVNHANPSRAYAQAGASVLAIPASDEDVSGWQHSRTALLRGVENGQAIVWSGRQTTLMVSDGWGRVLAAAPTGGPGPFTTVVADVPDGPGSTLYTRFGDWFAWLCLGLTVCGVLGRLRSSYSG
jgi:apolipoprotein N-acyltransferase